MARIAKRLLVIGLLLGVVSGLYAQQTSAASSKTVDTTSPAAGQQFTYTITIDESVEQHNGRPIVSGSITDEITAPFTFVSVSCSLSCDATTPAVGASGTVTITGFGQSEGPHDPALTGKVTLLVAAPDTVGATFTNQACIDVFVTQTISEPAGCVTAPEVTTIAAPTATATATATDTPTATATNTVTPSPTNTAAATPTDTPTPTATGTVPASATPTSAATVTATIVPTATATSDEPDDAALGDAASTDGTDVTTLPSTGAQSPAASDGWSWNLIGLLVGAAIVSVLVSRLWRARNLTIGGD